MPEQPRTESKFETATKTSEGEFAVPENMSLDGGLRDVEK
jgi:hypothetical protein